MALTIRAHFDLDLMPHSNDSRPIRHADLSVNRRVYWRIEE